MKTINHGSIKIERLDQLFPNRPVSERLVMMAFTPVGKSQEYLVMLNQEQIKNLTRVLNSPEGAPLIDVL